MNIHAKTLVELLSYSATDWVVSSKDEDRIIKLIRSDPNISATIDELTKKKYLGKLFARVNSFNNEKVLVQSLAGKIPHSKYPVVFKYVIKHTTHRKMFERSFALQKALKTHGLFVSNPLSSKSMLSTALSKLNPPKSANPYSGSGATGIDPKKSFLNLVDQALLAVRYPKTVSKYSNPIPGSLSYYLSTLTKDQRKAQATALLKRPIVSCYNASYCGKIPTRTDLIRAAANKHNLEPALIAAVILAEQRDQSRNEDLKDYTAATSLLKGNTSIGLGQVVVSTARRHDLFADLLSSHMTMSLSHSEIAILLTSDDFNIFAVAKYIRKVANSASSKIRASLPNTVSAFPKLRLHSFKSNSSLWSDDNIRALASEYTSRPWDDRVSPGWGYFVYEAYKDIKTSGAI